MVFLGLETWDPSSSAWFALDIKENAAETAQQVGSLKVVLINNHKLL